MAIPDVFKFGKVQAPGDPVEKRKLELKKYLSDADSKIRTDWNNRVNGDGVYVGYKLLRDFYKGRQWRFVKEGTMRTYNYCFTIVENMTAFLTNEPPQMSCPPTDSSDVLERAFSESRTKILREIHKYNKLPVQFQRGGRIGSLLGDTFIFGPFPEFELSEELADPADATKGMKKKLKSIKYWVVENPENIRPIWKDENFTEMYAFVHQYRMNVNKVREMYASEIKDAGITVNADSMADYQREYGQAGNPTQMDMTTVKELWMENECLITLNNGKDVIKYTKHDWGFLPIQYIPNIHVPGEPKGTSDIENDLDAQQEYNERSSDLGDIIKEIAHPAYWGKNLDNMTEIRSGNTVIYNVGDDADIQAMPKSGQTAPVEVYLNDRKNDIVQLSGMNNVLYPNQNVTQATGRALSVIMQGVNNKIALRKEWWISAFKDLNAKILFLCEHYLPESAKVINGNYDSDVFISAVLLRNTTDEINKFNARVQSLRTTQENLGIPQPSEEQKLMKEELQDPLLMPDISKQPGLIKQTLTEQAAAAQQPEVPVNGAPEVAGGLPVIGDESANQSGDLPANPRGAASPVSAEGSVRQVASRRGARTQVKQ